MKIALYAHNLHQSGGLTVGRAITSELPKIASAHRFLIAVPAERGYDALKELENVEICELPVGSYWERLKFERRFAKRLKEWKCDWAWVLGNNLFYWPQVPCSLLIQNAFYLNYPLTKLGVAANRSLRMKIERYFVARAVRKSRRIYGQTETVCRRLSETFGVSSDRVSLCATGGFADVVRQDDFIPEAARTIEKNVGKFRALYVAAPYLHKNHTRIVETFAAYRSALRDVVCFFTFDETENEETQRLARLVRETGTSENIRFIGTVPHSQIASCFRAADVCLYPTLLETVGIGILEGMSFGLPTIVSDFDFTREICGDAAVFVDPISLESIRDGILRLKNDATFCEEMRKRAVAQSATSRRTWRESLTQVLDVEGVPY